MLRDETEAHGRLISGPFPTRLRTGRERTINGYAIEPRVKAPTYNSLLAVALKTASSSLSVGTTYPI